MWLISKTLLRSEKRRLSILSRRNGGTPKYPAGSSNCCQSPHGESTCSGSGPTGCTHLPWLFSQPVRVVAQKMERSRCGGGPGCRLLFEWVFVPMFDCTFSGRKAIFDSEAFKFRGSTCYIWGGGACILMEYKDMDKRMSVTQVILNGRVLYILGRSVI